MSSLFPLLAAIFALVVIADVFVSYAVIYHIRKYSMSDWKLPKIIVPAYLLASVICFIAAAVAIAGTLPS